MLATALARSSTSNRQDRFTAETRREPDFETLRPRLPPPPARVSQHSASNTAPFPSSPVRAQSKPRTQRRIPFQTRRLCVSAVYPKTCHLCFYLALNRHLEYESVR